VLNPFTVKMDVRGGRLLFWQEVDGERFPKNKEYWTEDEIVYLRDYSPTDDVGAGVAACAVAMGGASLRHYLTKFGTQFFEHGAMPVTMVSMPVGTQATERERVENFFKRTIQGIRNAFRVIGVSGETKVTMLTPQLDTLAMPDVDARAIDDVAWAFDIPVSLLKGSSANYAEKDADMKSFVSDTISPRTKFYESGFRSFLGEYGQRLEFDIQSLPIMQEDEASRSGALKNLTDAGVPLRAALLMLGYDLSDDVQAELDKPKEEKPEEPVAPQLPPEEPVKSTPVEVHFHSTNDVKAPDVKFEPNITVQPADVIVEQPKKANKVIEVKRDGNGKMLSAEVKDA
jgi:HK97 family phage portal protein